MVLFASMHSGIAMLVDLSLRLILTAVRREKGNGKTKTNKGTGKGTKRDEEGTAKGYMHFKGAQRAQRACSALPGAAEPFF